MNRIKFILAASIVLALGFTPLAFAEETVIYHHQDKRPIARTGESLYNFIVEKDNGTASISNEDEPISEEGYVGILGVNLNVPTWNDWAQASIELKTEYNGDSYDLAECDGGFSYEYKGNAHRVDISYKDSEGKLVLFYAGTDANMTANTSADWATVTMNTYTRDIYDESTQDITTLNLSAVKNIQWTIRPGPGTNPGSVSNGFLQISEINCLGDLQLPPPTIDGPENMVRIVGYAATSTGIFTITEFEPVEVTLDCNNCDSKITWNGTTKKLDIDAGLPVGIYEVTLTAGSLSGKTSANHSFTFTVSQPPPPAPPAIITDNTLPAGEVDAAYATTLLASGTTPIVWTIKSGSSLPEGLELSENGIISGTPTTEGAFNFTVVATNSVEAVEKEFSIVIAPKPVVPIIAGIPKVNTLKVYVKNGTLHLSGLIASKAWSVYTASGTLVHKGIANGTEASLHLNTSGIYFVKSNGQVSRPLTYYY